MDICATGFMSYAIQCKWYCGSGLDSSEAVIGLLALANVASICSIPNA